MAEKDSVFAGETRTFFRFLFLGVTLPYIIGERQKLYEI